MTYIKWKCLFLESIDRFYLKTIQNLPLPYLYLGWHKGPGRDPTSHASLPQNIFFMPHWLFWVRTNFPNSRSVLLNMLIYIPSLLSTFPSRKKLTTVRLTNKKKTNLVLWQHNSWDFPDLKVWAYINQTESYYVGRTIAKTPLIWEETRALL